MVEKNNLPLPETFDMNNQQSELAKRWPSNGSTKVIAVEVFRHKGVNHVSDAKEFYFHNTEQSEDWVKEYRKRVEAEDGPLFISLIIFPPEGRLQFKDFYNKSIAEAKKKHRN